MPYLPELFPDARLSSYAPDFQTSNLIATVILLIQ
jgi:hypothetical protein